MKLARVMTDSGDVVYASQSADGTLHRVTGDPYEGNLKATDEVIEAKAWLPPVEPKELICIGLNYRKHAEEGGSPIPEYPVVFMKNLSAAIGHGAPIRKPAVCEDEVDFEAELAIVIGKTCRNATKENARDFVLGYTAANDVSARVWQSKKGGTQWVRGKSFDTFAPLGPVLVTADEMGDPNALAIRSELNGQQMQSSNTRDMIFDVPTLISFLSQDTTLLPGTVILTGTPEGIGWARNPKILLEPGGTITIEIEGIGKLTNPVEAAEA